MSTITDGTTTITPELVLSVAATQQGGTVFHDIIGDVQSPDPVIVATVRPARPRAGTLELFFLDAESAEACRALHESPSLFTFDDTDQPTRSMTYGVTSISPALDDQTRMRWIVTVGYQEVIL
jgi:hypothetical protein